MDKKSEKILIFIMALALIALPILYKAETYAQIEDGMIGPDGMINQHPGIMRFHVIANSDSSEDQNLKLKVRDYVLSKVQNEIADAIKNAENSDDDITQSQIMRSYIKSNLPKIEGWAEEAIRLSEFDYDARACIGIRHIPAKNYGDLYFPEGNYEALTITIGEGKGQNWWCVVFPPLCLVDSDDSAYREAFDIGEEETLQLKFKTVELLKGLNDDSDTDVPSSLVLLGNDIAGSAFQEAINQILAEVTTPPQN
ncbi:MAG: stage II sporulation protein R [Firmicutes bacterium]|nr:stage II sporulation protein R [Bacillota bacterium]